MNRIDILRDELENDPTGVGYNSMTYPEIAARLNKPIKKNPEPQKDVPMQHRFLDFMALLTPEESIALYNSRQLKVDLEFAIIENNQEWIKAMMNVMKPILSAKTRAKATEMFAMTSPDPDWKSHIGLGRAEELGIENVRPEEVQEALN